MKHIISLIKAKAPDRCQHSLYTINNNSTFDSSRGTEHLINTHLPTQSHQCSLGRQLKKRQGQRSVSWISSDLTFIFVQLLHAGSDKKKEKRLGLYQIALGQMGNFPKIKVLPWCLMETAAWQEHNGAGFNVFCTSPKLKVHKCLHWRLQWIFLL